MQYKFYNTIQVVMWLGAVLLTWVLLNLPVHHSINTQQLQQIYLAGAR